MKIVVLDPEVYRNTLKDLNTQLGLLFLRPFLVLVSLKEWKCLYLNSFIKLNLRLFQ